MRICDVCKKELSCGGVAKVVIPHHWLFDHSMAYDMCKECAKKVDDYISKLAEEARSKREGGDK